jgi:hypothetical protein
MNPIIFTVCALCSLSKPSHSGDTVTVVAVIDSFYTEADGDVHLVLRDSGCRMIAEITDSADIRPAFDAEHHPKRKHMGWGERERITGIIYYDHAHNVKFHAPNWIEIHPVTKIEPASGN